MSFLRKTQLTGLLEDGNIRTQRFAEPLHGLLMSMRAGSEGRTVRVIASAGFALPRAYSPEI